MIFCHSLLIKLVWLLYGNILGKVSRGGDCLGTHPGLDSGASPSRLDQSHWATRHGGAVDADRVPDVMSNQISQ